MLVLKRHPTGADGHPPYYKGVSQVLEAWWRLLAVVPQFSSVRPLFSPRDL